MVHDQPKGIGADVALADRLVAVDPRATCPLRVVGMDHLQAFEADRGIELGQRAIEFLPGRQAVARGEHVTRIEADRRAGGMAGSIDRLQHVRNLLERVAEARALACRCLDQDAGGQAAGAAERRGDAVCGPLHCLITGLFAGGTGMGHHPGNVELGGPFEFHDESVDRFLSQHRIRGRGVDQIGIVCHDERQPRSLDCGLEGLRIGGVDRRDVPAVDVAREHLQTVAACFHGTLHRPAQTAGNRLMGTHDPAGVAAPRSDWLSRGFAPGSQDFFSRCCACCFRLHAALVRRQGGWGLFAADGHGSVRFSGGLDRLRPWCRAVAAVQADNRF